MFHHPKHWWRLLCLLLVAEAINSSAVVFKAESGRAPQSASDNLLTQIFEQHFQVSNFALDESARIARAVLQDGSQSNEEMRKSLQDYVKDVEQEQQNTVPPSNNVANRFLQLVSKTLIYQQFEKIETAVGATSTLKRHGLEQFQAQLEERRKEFLQSFLQLVAEYIRANERDGQAAVANERLRNWYARYERVRDMKRIDEMLSEFLTLV